jgi:hypothetical protein
MIYILYIIYIEIVYIIYMINNNFMYFLNINLILNLIKLFSRIMI